MSVVAYFIVGLDLRSVFIVKIQGPERATRHESIMMNDDDDD
jgi:hypothetical protein